MVLVLFDPGPSSTSKAQLVQQLVQDFPKAFQLVSTHSTPAYGQAASSDAAADPQPGRHVVVSPIEFQVSVCMTLASPSASNSHRYLLSYSHTVFISVYLQLSSEEIDRIT